MNKIHKTAIIHKNVKIGADCVIGPYAVIYPGSIIGNDVRIDEHASIGKQPMKAVNSATTDDKRQPPAIISDGVIVGTSAVIYSGCKIAKNVLIADLATVRENVKIGMNTIIGRGAAIENHTIIGKMVKIETNAYITAHSVIGDYCFIAPNVTTSNDNFAGRTIERKNAIKGIELKEGARLGAGCVVLPGKLIGKDGFVAAGAVVTHDVEGKTIVAGCPAKKLRNVPDDQLLINQDYYMNQEN